MAMIPKQDLIKDILESGDVLQEPREYIGMSSLNSPCSRKIWYDFHWAYDRYISKRLARIFERGDLEEHRVVKDLNEAGLELSAVLENQETIIDHTGHIKGHPDGLAIKVPGAEKTEHLLEIKTMNSKRFKDYVKNGLEKTNPSYWGQVHTYMGEKGLTRCLFVVTNKDNEERHYERIKYNPGVHDMCMSRGMDILTSEFIPNKIGEATWFECKQCDAKNICHKNAKINRNCRTCKNFNIEMEGRFSCGLHDGLILARANQEAGCPDYEISEAF